MKGKRRFRLRVLPLPRLHRDGPRSGGGGGRWSACSFSVAFKQIVHYYDKRARSRSPAAAAHGGAHGAARSHSAATREPPAGARKEGDTALLVTEAHVKQFLGLEQAPSPANGPRVR